MTQASDPALTAGGASLWPATDNTLIGREVELAKLVGLLHAPGRRILTLTGPPGVGKSRLARAAATRRQFAHGTFVVDLGHTADPAEAWRRIAQGLGASAPPSGPSGRDLAAGRIGERELLLLLDNCDLVAAPICLDLARLFERSPGLHILVSSRVSLNISNEQLFPVRPLPVSPEGGPRVLANPDAPAVRLFVERARAQRPNYALLDEDIDVIAAICRAVDGLPLAIELSAAVVGMVGPRALLQRVRQGDWASSSRLLDVPPRHRTVSESISWGDRLLPPDTRRFLQQLAVCEGRFDVSTAQHVTDLEWSQVIRNLEALVHMSLLQRFERADGDVGFCMLNTIRSYYLRHAPLDDQELTQTRDRHAHHFAEVAAGAEEELNGPHQAKWLTTIGDQLHCHRAAISHLQTAGDHATAAGMLLALEEAWAAHNLLPAMTRTLLQSVTELECDDAPGAPQLRPLLARSFEAVGAWSLRTGATDTAEHALKRAEDLYRAGLDRAGAARTAGRLSELLRRRGDAGPAADLASFAVAELALHGQPRDIATARHHQALAEAALDKPDAEADLRRAIHDLSRHAGPRAHSAALVDLARLHLERQQPAPAYAAIREAMQLLRGGSAPQQTTDALETAARILPLVREGQQHRAARLLLITRSTREELGLPDPDDNGPLEELRSALQNDLGASTVTELERQIQGTSLLSALNDALSAPPEAEPAPAPRTGTSPLSGLTPRQVQIAEKVAEGLTNRQIARELELSEWTVINHLRQVMRKLDCPSRVHVARLVQQAAE
ncbi:ATP-binding protein [Streptomyces sp. NPDC001930]|uniref:ATP-binding protein n=1 Tax=Streptomyces sp. NPDC001930 TaxID=3364625 RepID=UPI0036B8EA11